MRLWLVLAALASAAAAQPLDVPFFRQQTNGCGAASVAMVMRYWQPDSPPTGQIYRELYVPEKKGIPLAAMRQYLEDAGFRAFTIRGEWSDLEQHLAKGRPIIVGLKPRQGSPMHFAVLAGIDAGHVWLHDPTRRKVRRVKQGDFRKQWDLAERWMLLSTPVSSLTGS